MGLARTPAPPYYAVIFTSARTNEDVAGYAAAAARMLELAAQQPGYLGVESAHEVNGVGITVSYWNSPEAIRAWRNNAEHQIAQHGGRSRWYAEYELRICRVENATRFAAHP
jgi:heme-degrading monooxygenase HmoA